MSLPLPRLDDRTWQDLRDEGVSLIPRFAPTWTVWPPSCRKSSAALTFWF